ncbi:hypothetical protein AVEN_14665-1 [Araneus ventricosus]|uniref:Uncharacterized protein n=1 Tax=Araneus ventricosus TaxID=182803 RepID=A0A4Y2ICD1_ARAVE|nr:hypothetical protein AVEN_14665-1 [Araneus ventricosus]
MRVLPAHVSACSANGEPARVRAAVRCPKRAYAAAEYQTKPAERNHERQDLLQPASSRERAAQQCRIAVNAEGQTPVIAYEIAVSHVRLEECLFNRWHEPRARNQRWYVIQVVHSEGGIKNTRQYQRVTENDSIKQVHMAEEKPVTRINTETRVLAEPKKEMRSHAGW